MRFTSYVIVSIETKSKRHYICKGLSDCVNTDRKLLTWYSVMNCASTNSCLSLLDGAVRTSGTVRWVGAACSSSSVPPRWQSKPTLPGNWKRLSWGPKGPMVSSGHTVLGPTAHTRTHTHAISNRRLWLRLHTHTTSHYYSWGCDRALWAWRSCTGGEHYRFSVTVISVCRVHVCVCDLPAVWDETATYGSSDPEDPAVEKNLSDLTLWVALIHWPARLHSTCRAHTHTHLEQNECADGNNKETASPICLSKQNTSTTSKRLINDDMKISEGRIKSQEQTVYWKSHTGTT